MLTGLQTIHTIALQACLEYPQPQLLPKLTCGAAVAIATSTVVFTAAGLHGSARSVSTIFDMFAAAASSCVGSCMNSLAKPGPESSMLPGTTAAGAAAVMKQE
jgi:hypothetical protein